MTRDPATRLLAAYDSTAQIAPLSEGLPDLDEPAAYAIAHRITALREARGERRMGRKIGFTNRSIWPLYGVSGPVWGPVWDSTLHELTDAPVALPAQPEPRLEPEIIFGLGRAPRTGMSPDQIAACIDWVSHGFEIVFSPFPGWRFTGPDCAAAFALHGALYIGPRQPLTAGLAADLPALRLTLTGPGTTLTGRGADVLDGPIQALSYLLDRLAADPDAPPLAAGEIVTTGTLTDAVPVAAGQTWHTEIDGADLPGAAITFR